MDYLALIILHSFFINTLPTRIDKVTNPGYQEEGIELIISNIRNRTGIIRIGMYNSDKGYPDNPAVSFSLAKDTLVSGKLRLFIPIKQPGIFGISILDDENENGKMDYRFVIIPREGYGFSNNPKVTSRKAPPFNETRFNYQGGRIQISVEMNYI
jgi:uncharacterized protein (DUF2141 family)